MRRFVVLIATLLGALALSAAPAQASPYGDCVKVLTKQAATDSEGLPVREKADHLRQAVADAKKECKGGSAQPEPTTVDASVSKTVTGPGTYTLTSVLPAGYHEVAAPVISPSDSRPGSPITYVSFSSDGQTATYSFRTNGNTTYPLVVTLHRGGTR